MWEFCLHGIKQQYMLLLIFYYQYFVIGGCRLLIGAPKGTYPGGLNLTDLFQPAEKNTGLVYSCSVLGTCEGVIGNVSRYINDEKKANGAVIDNVVYLLNELYPQAVSEGRLFDQARKYVF